MTGVILGCERHRTGRRVFYFEQVGLGDALRILASDGSGLRPTIAVRSDFGARLSNDEALALYRIAQEALQNVVKHSEADRVMVVLADTCQRIWT